MQQRGNPATDCCSPCPTAEPVQEIEAAEILLDHQVDGLIVISARVPIATWELPRGVDRETGEKRRWCW